MRICSPHSRVRRDFVPREHGPDRRPFWSRATICLLIGRIYLATYRVVERSCWERMSAAEDHQLLDLNFLDEEEKLQIEAVLKRSYEEIKKEENRLKCVCVSISRCVGARVSY